MELSNNIVDNSFFLLALTTYLYNMNREYTTSTLCNHNYAMYRDGEIHI